jgi:hypothetical protein
LKEVDKRWTAYNSLYQPERSFQDDPLIRGKALIKDLFSSELPRIEYCLQKAIARIAIFGFRTTAG